MKESRFAGAGRPHDGNEIAFLDLEIDVAQNVKELLFAQRIATLNVIEAN
jgi:hypothetical protein